MHIILAWLGAPGHAVYLWCVLSAMLNVFFRIHSAGEWVAYAERNPRLSAAAAMMRSIGLDPAGLLDALVAYVAMKAKGQSSGFARVRALVLALVVIPLAVGLTCLSRPYRKAVTPDLGITGCAVQQAMKPAEECVLANALAIALAGGFSDPQRALEAIFKDCGNITIDDILAAIDAAEMQACACSDGGPPPAELEALRVAALQQKAMGHK